MLELFEVISLRIYRFTRPRPLHVDERLLGSGAVQPNKGKLASVDEACESPVGLSH